MRHNISTSQIPLPIAERTPSGELHANLSAGHVSVRLDEAQPDITFSFERQSERLVPAFGAALLLEVAIVVLFVLIARYAPSFTITPAALPDEISDQIVWLSQPGPGGGGGGGGNKTPEPPKKAELPGKDKITVPVEKPRPITPPQQAKVEPNPIEQLNIPAKTLSAGADALPGAIDAPPGPPTASLGAGSGGGAGRIRLRI